MSLLVLGVFQKQCSEWLKGGKNSPSLKKGKEESRTKDYLGLTMSFWMCLKAKKRYASSGKEAKWAIRTVRALIEHVEVQSGRLRFSYNWNWTREISKRRGSSNTWSISRNTGKMQGPLLLRAGKQFINGYESEVLYTLFASAFTTTGSSSYDMCWPPISGGRVVFSLLQGLSPHKSMGLDVIHSRALREISDNVAKLLSIIFEKQ